MAITSRLSIAKQNLSMPSFACFDTEPDDLAIVIAFDPGGTTGYCVMGIRPDDLERGSDLPSKVCYADYGEIDCGTRHGQTGAGMLRGHGGLNMPGEIDGIMRMMRIWDSFENPVIVLEDFVLDMNKANMGRELLTPVRIIAGFTTLLQYSVGDAMKLEGVFVQNRSPVKTTCTDDRLKNWNFYDRASGPHARDATRHAYYFLRTASGNDDDARLKRHLAWPYLFDDPMVRPKDKTPKSQPGQRVWGLG